MSSSLSDSVPAAAPLVGDRSRRRSAISLLAALCALPPTLWVFLRLDDMWPTIAAMEGIGFMAATTLLGASMAIGPLVIAIALLLATWFSVESVYQPRTHPTPALDRGIIGLGLLVWFAPALVAVGSALRAVLEGRIHFVRPPRDYFLATDPIAFWQGVGFWLIMAALFGFLAWRYWQPKLFPAHSAARHTETP